MAIPALLLISALALLVRCSSDAPSGNQEHDGGGATDGDSGSACRGLAGCEGCTCGASNCPVNSPMEATTCTPDSQLGLGQDLCGCDGKTCTQGITCVHVYEPSPWGGGGSGTWFNGCFGLCDTDADCGGLVCRRNRFGLAVCANPDCASDADCTADQCGHCVPLALLFHVGQVLLDFTSSSCVYEGPCRSDSCAGCMTSWEHDKTLKAFHACMP